MCPACNHELDAATSATNEREEPKEGDFSLCFYCGEILRFTGEGLDLKVANQNDMEELLDDSIETYDALLDFQNHLRIKNS